MGEAQMVTIEGLELAVNGEPRMRDVDLGERLGFARPRDVRKIIDRKRVELERYGDITIRATVARIEKSGAIGGVEEREVQEYWLNEGQAILVSVLSDAPKAPEVRELVIRVFMLARRGQLQSAPSPALPPAMRSTLPAEMIAALTRNPGKTYHELSLIVRVQHSTARDCLLQLEQQGVVTRSIREGRGKATVWTLVPTAEPSGDLPGPATRPVSPEQWPTGRQAIAAHALESARILDTHIVSANRSLATIAMEKRFLEDPDSAVRAARRIDFHIARTLASLGAISELAQRIENGIRLLADIESEKLK
mgnify:CR=1 FL=1